MNRRTLERFLNASRRTALAAGRAILAFSAENVQVIAKRDGAPVSDADRVSHRLIESALQGLRPAFPIMSEEGRQDDILESNAKIYWLVDPLDGTKEYLKGLGEYTVNLALVEKGMPILGVICAPAFEALYYAAKGFGAWKLTSGQVAQRLEAASCDRPITAAASRSHLSPEAEAFLAGLGIQHVLRRGSSLKMCAVAEGQADLYPRFGPTYLWDTAAGTAIAVEAGCKVTDLSGRPLSYRPRCRSQATWVYSASPWRLYLHWRGTFVRALHAARHESSGIECVGRITLR